MSRERAELITELAISATGLLFLGCVLWMMAKVR